MSENRKRAPVKFIKGALYTDNKSDKSIRKEFNLFKSEFTSKCLLNPDEFIIYFLFVLNLWLYLYDETRLLIEKLHFF